MNPESPIPGAQTPPPQRIDPSVQQAQGRQIAESLLAKVGGADQPVPQGEQPIKGEVLVEHDGVQRRVNIDELLSKAGQAERLQAEAQAIASAAQAQLARNSAASQIAARIENMTQPQREALMKALQDPSSLTKPQQTDPFGLPVEQPGPSALETRLGQLEELAKTQAQFLTTIGRERAAQTIGQRIESEMSGLPVFGQIPAPLREAAREAIATEITRDPNADLTQVAIRHAKRAHDIHQQYLAQGGRPSAGSPQAPAGPSRRLTAEDLRKGSVLQHAREAMRAAGLPG